jgi:hypothetical protein
MNNQFFSKRFLIAIVAILMMPVYLTAQQSGTSDETSGKWEFLVEPYLMFPNMNGSVGLRNLPDAPVDASTNDIFNNLKMGFMLNVEASNDKWAIGSDVLYMSLGEDVKSGILINSGEIKAKQLGWEIMGLYRVTPWLELGLGGLINSIQGEVDLKLNQIGGGRRNESASKTETWFDPMILARIKKSEVDKFVYQFRGEIGGFGIGSDLAWQIQAYAGYRFSALFEMTAGYRIISLDYESGSSQNRFMYDVDTSGPVIRFGFNF